MSYTVSRNDGYIRMEGEPDLPYPVIDTEKLAKVSISHELLHQLLDLPDDVRITSMHTSRGEQYTGMYMICDRFDRVPDGAVAPEISIENVKSVGLWDSEGN